MNSYSRFLKNVFNEKIDETFREDVYSKLKIFYAGEIDTFSEYFKFKKSEHEKIWLHLFLIAETRNPETNKPIKVIGYHQDITKQIEM